MDSDRGNLAGAERAYEESLAIALELGRKKEVAMALNNIGNLMAKKGDLQAAIRRHEQTLAAYREMGDKSAVITSLLDLSGELQYHAELSRAHRILDEALRISREIDQKYHTRRRPRRARGHRHGRGGLATAMALGEEARDIAQPHRIPGARGGRDRHAGHGGRRKGQPADAERLARTALERFLKRTITRPTVRRPCTTRWRGRISPA